MKLRHLLLSSVMMLVPSVSLSQENVDGDEFIKVLESLAQIAVPPDYTSIQGVASGSVAPKGYAFVSLSGTTDKTTDGGNGEFDGAFAVGAGLGSLGPIDAQAIVNITSTNPKDFADSGSLGLKFGTKIPTSGAPYRLAVSFSNLGGWGDNENGDVNTTVALSSKTTRYRPSGPLSYSWSIGAVTDEGSNNWDPFVGLGLGLSQNLGISAAYSDRDEVVKLGTGWRLPEANGASLAVTLNDPFDMGAMSGVTVSLSWAFNAFGGIR
ncbi:hypothetical protein OIU14_01880 [Thalassobacter stenotrophicus]|uniref:hypothetical protein n=1 Tax=Thalassobacter stenotrophicus TaxID=266809 RepID=UPI0022A92394|nr:hypothetical protein [Thalassobacter stenotrophicus]UYP68516.1 hypothetical protein OIU14_01880 [Thalassobacter stenotrophicus]